MIFSNPLIGNSAIRYLHAPVRAVRAGTGYSAGGMRYNRMAFLSVGWQSRRAVLQCRQTNGHPWGSAPPGLRQELDSP